MRNVAGVAVLVGGLWLTAQGYGWALLVGMAVAGVLCAGRPVVRAHVHGHTRATIARHEAGHAAAARHLGGTVLRARVHDTHGYVQARLPSDRPEDAVAFWRAGALAAGTEEGAHEDNRLIGRELCRLPARRRGEVRARGEQIARQALAAQGGQIVRDAQRLEKRGRL